eukprot:scaffold32771_cov73-Phaeocystis_antarctica.AAC.1
MRALRAAQSQRVEGVTPHMSYCSSPCEAGLPGCDGCAPSCSASSQLARRRVGALERQREQREGVGEALHTDAYRPVAQVGVARLDEWVLGAVDDAVERLGHDARHVVQRLQVEACRRAALDGGEDEAGQCDRGQVADGHLVLRGVLDDLRAQVGAADRAEVALVGLCVARVLEHHVRRAWRIEGSGLGDSGQASGHHRQPRFGMHVARALLSGLEGYPGQAGGAYNWSGGWPHSCGLLRARACLTPLARPSPSATRGSQTKPSARRQYLARGPRARTSHRARRRPRHAHRTALGPHSGRRRTTCPPARRAS